MLTRENVEFLQEFNKNWSTTREIPSLLILPPDGMHEADILLYNKCVLTAHMHCLIDYQSYSNY